MNKALGMDSELNLCRACDSLYSLPSRQWVCPSVFMSVCAYHNYFLLSWKIIKTKASMDSFYKRGDFKNIFMRKGALERKIRKKIRK